MYDDKLHLYALTETYLLLCCACKCLLFTANRVHNRGDIYCHDNIASLYRHELSQWQSTIEHIPSSVRDCLCFLFLPYICISNFINLSRVEPPIYRKLFNYYLFYKISIALIAKSVRGTVRGRHFVRERE